MSGRRHLTRASGATQIAAPGTEGFPRGCLWAVNDFLYRPVGLGEQKGKTVLSETPEVLQRAEGTMQHPATQRRLLSLEKKCRTFLSRLTLRKVRKL